jgi:hypothetical protein
MPCYKPYRRVLLRDGFNTSVNVEHETPERRQKATLSHNEEIQPQRRRINPRYHLRLSPQQPIYTGGPALDGRHSRFPLPHTRKPSESPVLSVPFSRSASASSSFFLFFLFFSSASHTLFSRIDSLPLTIIGFSPSASSTTYHTLRAQGLLPHHGKPKPPSSFHHLPSF